MYQKNKKMSKSFALLSFLVDTPNQPYSTLNVVHSMLLILIYVSLCDD